MAPLMTSTKMEPERDSIKVHPKALTVDTHVDTPMLLVSSELDLGSRNTPHDSRVDFVRMEEGGLDAISFAAFTGQKERPPLVTYV